MSTPTVRRRKKPVEVDTIQWTGTNEADVQAFTTFTAPDGSYVLSANFYALDDEDRKNSDDPEATATVYDKLHSTWILVYTGQHIVRGVAGEFYPIAEDVLAETYEPADTPLHDACRAEAAAEALHAAADEIDRQVPDDERYVVKKTVVNILRRRANTVGEEATAAAATATPEPDFFEPGRTYTEPGDVTDWRFRCDAITTHPATGERTALGWKHFRGEWSECSYDEDEWEIHQIADAIGQAGDGRG